MDGPRWLQLCRDFCLCIAVAGVICSIIHNLYLENQLQNQRNQLQEHKEKLHSLEQQLMLVSRGREPNERLLRQTRSCGCQGLPGPKGETGLRGLKGYRGSVGPQGIGIKGEKGVKGIIGFKGERGQKGEKGQRGVKGRNADQLAKYAHASGHKANGFHRVSDIARLWNRTSALSHDIDIIPDNATHFNRLKVSEDGVYFIYAQLKHYKRHKFKGQAVQKGLTYDLVIDGKTTIATSTTTDTGVSESKFIGLLRDLKKSQTISVRLRYLAQIDFKESFFGAFYVSHT